jgi:hypothetical protein
MMGRSTVRVSALLAVLPLGSICAFASDATGVLHPTCDVVNQYLLDITSFHGHRLQSPIQFHVFGENGFQLYANQWVDTPGPGDAKVSRIQIVHLSHGRWRGTVMSGNFIVVFGDGKKVEGSFVAKYVEPPGLFVCE